ncbi:nuclear transport factor 2 family protein [Elizabethkingia sp. HX WHF]|uniref:Nuclear transport factor 2 family protein n=1 Tax=Elizabethkingia bruuniana TaxID=1756149 RepID=A0A7T7V181_9FLAO|nr:MULTISPECIES: nuclear transport factor 2 family protein [Elizabethkingia]ATL44778.1 nuclear transport factor 2 family protein [Elizabethkingia miricola]AQX86371.1 DUF4440 domain-containing protein [Elizabethkingia bruuniana]KGO11131.1 CbbQ/NirQ/NorQ/GpvN family protein [Elizabethkingia miricola]KUY24882.1 hypothetical protein ATB97_10110 [Elizabethkingia bruuniana]MCL1636524.1 nuclear transport factor 2 family protein [Elizabethkingia bruuniana]
MSKAQQFAKTWIEAWNSHDLDVILSHYSEDIEITTPMIKMALGEGDGSLKGKDAVADYWKRALDKIPDLHFVLYDVTEGVNSVALYYKSVMDKKAVEVMFFNEEGKVNKMFAHYTV